VWQSVDYQEVRSDLPARASLFLYTDGLIERRGESLDVGLQRLAAAAIADGSSLDDVLATIVHETIPNGSDDDAALVGVRWQN
jgi:hypothetical protein